MHKNYWVGYLLIAPAFLILFLVIFYPMIVTTDMSFQQILLMKPNADKLYIGIDNYIAIISNKVFSNAVINTAIWIMVNLVAQILIGLGLALLLNEKIFLRSFFRGALLIPWAIPSIVAVLSWRWMYDAQFGIINDLLIRAGILEKGIAWLGNTSTAMLAVLMESIWKGTPFVMVMILAGLQAVPDELYDAAKVDGAGSLKSLQHITLPLIKPTVILAVTLTTIYTFNNFNSIWLMTEGGPLRSTETLTILVYTRAFRDFNLGEAAAIGVIILLIQLFFVRFFGKNYMRSQLQR